MITGAHSIIYSKDPQADREFLREVLGLPHVDVGEGWLIFGLPPAELAVHPSDRNDVHEFYLIVTDAHEFAAEMTQRGVSADPIQDQGWGLLTAVALPGGGKLPVYQPRHARPPVMAAGKTTRPPARRTSARRSTARRKTTRRRTARRTSAAKASGRRSRRSRRTAARRR